MSSASDRRWLWWGNVAAAAFHWISFVAALIVSLVLRDKVYRSIVTLTTLEDVGGGVLGPVTRVLGRYALTGTLLPVPALTGTFHALLALVPFVRSDYEACVLNAGRAGFGTNPYRWIEYSLSASLVTWNIAQVSGICDLFVLLALIGLNIWMQLVGGLGHEWLNAGRTPAAMTARRWLRFAFGFLPFALTWGFIFPAFVLAVRSSTETVPWFVWLVVVGLFVQYTLFAVPIVLHYTGWWLTSNRNYELAYITLSFVSKAWLDWILIIGSVTR